MSRTLTIVPMDPPFESSRTTTAMRLIDCALQRGNNINVFAYEGAVMLPFRQQQPHANAAHGRNVDEEDHPLPREWVAALIDLAADQGVKLDWVNCGLCVDERGAGDAIAGIRRGGPPDLWAMVIASDNTMVIPTY